jgi:predicted transcriptional regulator
MKSTLSKENVSRFTEMSKALGHPIRFEIIQYLIAHPVCITGDIVDVLPIVQSTTSQHLKILKSSGWIRGTITGTSTSYCLDHENINWFKKMMEDKL